MKTDNCAKEDFLRNISDHKLEILQDNGLYRHLMFKKKNTICGWFEIVTWPGHLCINGDMGTYSFARVSDMFTFFRCEKNELYINPAYWSEKNKSCSIEKIKEYSEEKFERIVKEHLDDIGASKELREAVDDDILSIDMSDESYARESVNNFAWEGEYIFQDFWEHDLKEYTYHYLWNCYAIVWGIMEYDKMKNQQCESPVQTFTDVKIGNTIVDFNIPTLKAENYIMESIAGVRTEIPICPKCHIASVRKIHKIAFSPYFQCPECKTKIV